jgi:hypothetical protein
MEAVYPFETSVLAHQSTWFHNPEEHKLIFAIKQKLLWHHYYQLLWCHIALSGRHWRFGQMCCPCISTWRHSRIRRNVDIYYTTSLMKDAAHFSKTFRQYQLHCIPEDGASRFSSGRSCENVMSPSYSVTEHYYSNNRQTYNLRAHTECVQCCTSTQNIQHS